MTEATTKPITAEECDQVEIIHLQRQGEVAQRLLPDSDIRVEFELSGGIVVRTLTDFGGKLNRVEGLGVKREVTDSHVKKLWAVFNQLNLYPEFRIGPSAHGSTLQILSSNGYIIARTIDTYSVYLDTTSLDEKETSRGFQKSTISISNDTEDPTSIENFVEASATGFGDIGRSSEVLRFLAQIAAVREDTQLFTATINDEVAGTAALAQIQLGSRSAGYLYLDSTTPKYRGKGVQLSLIRARLIEARRCGISVVFLSCR